MTELTPLNSLKFFEDNLPQFLSDDREIKTLVTKLREILINDEGSSDFHANLVDCGKDFIKRIILKSIEYLSDESEPPSPKTRSIKDISNYIDSFVLFEEMLFGLDKNYRDHTLHVLWVYLFGHEFIICTGGYQRIKIAGQMSIIYPQFAHVTEPIVCTEEHLEAMWGMISMLHDLGYPVEAISKEPHEVFGRILDPFGIDFSSIFQIDLGSRINLLYQSVCDLLSTMYRPRPLTPDEEKEYFKGSSRFISSPPTTAKAEAIEMEFRIASVDKKHSAWSVILAFKNISYLHESDYHGGGNRNFPKLMTKRDILYSIVHHTSEEPKDEAVNRFQFILLLIDDIEDSMRYSHGGRTRGSESNRCKVKWEMSENKTIIEMDYTEYKYKARDKHREMEDKYKAQIRRTNQGQNKHQYVIEIKFMDGKDHLHEGLQLFLVSDAAPRPTPSLPPPGTR